MKLITLEKKTGDRIEHINLIINIYLLLRGIELTETDKKILSYFCNYGINLRTEKLIYNSNIITSKNTYRNTISRFKKLGFLDKNIRREYLITDSILSSIDNKLALLIKIDNT